MIRLYVQYVMNILGQNISVSSVVERETVNLEVMGASPIRRDIDLAILYFAQELHFCDTFHFGMH